MYGITYLEALYWLSLSLQTRQLHIHVSARNADDVAWPNVHLNASGRTYFAPEELQQHRQYLIQAFQEEETYFVAEED